MSQAYDILKEITQPAISQMRVVESEDELKNLCSEIARDGDSIVLLQAFEHDLRSYQPFQCWLLLTVVKGQSIVRSFLVDAIAFKESIYSSVGAICRAPAILKVVESTKILEKLQTEFNCYILNVLVSQRPVETINYFSSILIKQDYRIRPANQSQI